MAVRLYAVAAQIYALYVQADWVNRQCFPQSAEGEYLDRHAQLRGLERRAAVAAEGSIRFETDSATQADLTIPAGTVCMTAGLIRFETTREVTLRAGQTQVDAPAAALEPGAAGNVAAGTIRAMAVAPVGVSRCTNPEGFSGGLDAEDDETLRTRVLETFQRMPNGANAAYYEQSAMSFPQVAAAAVVSRPRGVGSVDVVVATAAGVPDEELLEELQAYFEERREIAVDVLVRAPETENVNVTVQIQTAANRDGETVRQNVEGAIRGWFNGQRLGQNILRAKLGQLIYEVDGVENYALTAPAADVTVEHDVLPRLNSLSVTRTEETA
ncbi:baseplate J/gp47 family protein [Flavonifractor plautii]|nr:baseplate J/gp47 family protein [Flavonifractor plautii]